MVWFKLLILLVVGSCGTIQKWGLRSTTPVFEKSSLAMMKEANWDFFSLAAPGSLKLMDGLYEQDRDNYNLLKLLIKSYAGYAYAIHETIYFGDELASVSDSKARKDAIYFYTRAFDYGLSYLQFKGITKNDLLAHDGLVLENKLKKLDSSDLSAILYTAQAWGGLINLQKDNVSLVFQVSKVKIFFDHVCSIQPGIDFNICDIFYAQYEASRPKMLGGNPQKAEQLFVEAIKRNPLNLLIRLSYIQYSILPQMDLDKYEVQSKILKDEFLKWEDMRRDQLENRSPYKDVQELNLLNAIAKKRFEYIEKFKEKIF